ncbi:MAG: hypothetical protein V4556_07465 [Bacteroidota bacterium]
MRFSIYLTILLLIASCKSKEEKFLINGNNDMWRVVQQGQHRIDSSLEFFKFNSDNTFDEIYFLDNKFKKMDSNPDILNWHKWQQVSDSIFKIAHIEFRVITLMDSFAQFGNIKRQQDTLTLLRKKILKGSFTSYP